jgi:PEP-CTERM motif
MEKRPSDPDKLSDARPEPATWGLMLLGFGGLGAVARRKKAAAVA